MADTTTDLVIPGAEWDAHEHADGDLDALLRVIGMFGVAVPVIGDVPLCGAEHPSRWECTRAQGHHGRHCAYLWNGAVAAVWHQQDY